MTTTPLHTATFDILFPAGQTIDSVWQARRVIARSAEDSLCRFWNDARVEMTGETSVIATVPADRAAEEWWQREAARAFELAGWNGTVHYGRAARIEQ